MARHSIRSQLLAVFMALITVSVALTGLGLGWRGYRENIDTAYGRQQELAKRVAVQIRAELQMLETELTSAARISNLARLTPAERERYVDRLLSNRESFREAFFVDAAGKRQAFRSNLRLTAVTEPPDPAAVEAGLPLESRGVRFGKVSYDTDNNEPFMLVGIPVKAPGSPTAEGLLAAEVRLKRIWNLMAGMVLEPGEDVYLLDQADRVIAHRNPSVVLRETRFPPDQEVRRQVGLNGNEAFVATESFEIGQQKFRVVAERDFALASAPAMANLKLTLAAIFVSLTATFFILIPVSRRITKPLTALSGAARAIRDGDLGRKVDAEIDNEIGDLAQSFNQMTERLSHSLRQLEDERTQLRTLISTIPDLIWLKDADGVYLSCNPAFERFFGAKEADIAGKTDYDFVDRELADFFREKDRAAMEAGRPVSNTEWITFADDGQRRLVETLKTPMRSGDGTLFGVLGVARDITEHQRTEAELRAAHKDLQAFTYAASHDMRAPLGRINSFGALLERDYRDSLDGEGIRFLDFIRRDTRRLLALVNDLQVHAEIEQRALVLEAVDIREVVADVLGNFADAIDRTTADIRVQLAATPVHADRRSLARALGSLLENALRYSSSGKRPVIEIGNSVEGSRCRLWIKDNGIGFDMVYHDRIFEVFRRLHTYEEYPGSGLGLALAKRAIERMGGTVWAESRPGEGATFYLELNTRPI